MIFFLKHVFLQCMQFN